MQRDYDNIVNASTREEAQALLDQVLASPLPPPAIMIEVLRLKIAEKPDGTEAP